MTTTVPTVTELKTQARLLRQAMAGRGTTLPHSAALELVAQSHGARDWNTLSARADSESTTGKPQFGVGDHVRGRYLNQPFEGRILSVAALAGGGLFNVVIHFDEPVDVVTFDSFSAFRQRVTAKVNAQGVSPRKTSNGIPHLVLDR